MTEQDLIKLLTRAMRDAPLEDLTTMRFGVRHLPIHSVHNALASALDELSALRRVEAGK